MSEPAADQPIPLRDYAALRGISMAKVHRDIAAGALPVWRDPILRKKVTTLGAIARVQAAAAEKAEREYIQKHRLNK